MAPHAPTRESSPVAIGRLIRTVVPAALVALAACEDDDAALRSHGPTPVVATELGALAAEVRRLTAGRGITPLERPAQVRPALVQLGQALAFDKILSGNRDISCMTCHLPRLGHRRRPQPVDRAGRNGPGVRPRPSRRGAFIPRNAPPLFNLSRHADRSSGTDGSRGTRPGRSTPPPATRLTPEMTRVFEFGALSALPLFPVLSRSEMRADAGNELAAVPDDQEPEVWAALMERLGRIRRVPPVIRGRLPGPAVRPDDVRAREQRHRRASSSSGCRSTTPPGTASSRATTGR